MGNIMVLGKDTDLQSHAQHTLAEPAQFTSSLHHYITIFSCVN